MEFERNKGSGGIWTFDFQFTRTDALTNWATDPLRQVFFFYLSIINKMNLREIKAQQGFGPSTSSLLGLTL